MTAQVTGKNRLRRLAALACLLAFGLGPTKLFPLVVALAAGAEGSHFVHLEEDSTGETKVVLSHTPSLTRPVDGHHHGVASRVVCLLGGATSEQADHVASLASGGVPEGEWKASRLRCALSVSKFSSAVQAGAVDICPSMLGGAGSKISGNLPVTDTRPMQPRIECLRSICLRI